MKRYSKIFAAVLAVCTLAAVVFGIAVRKSYKHTTASPEERLSYTVQPMEVPETETVEDTIQTYLSESNFVAKVRFTGERTECFNSMLSTVEVLAVYVGDQGYTGKTVRIYEQFRFADVQSHVQSAYCFLPMQSGREYFVFAKHKDYIDVYQQKLPYEEFRLYCGRFGGCFAAENEPLPIVEAQTLTWQEAAAYDFIFRSEAEFDSCMDQKNAILAYFDIPYTFPHYDELVQNQDAS